MRKISFYLFLFLFLYTSVSSQTKTVINRAELWYRSNELDSTGTNWRGISGEKLALVSKGANNVSDSMYNFHRSVQIMDSTGLMGVNYPVKTIQRLTVITVYTVSDTSKEQGIWSLEIDGKQLTGLSDRQLIRERSAVTYPVHTKGIPIINTSVQSFTKKRGDTIVFKVGTSILPDSTQAYLKGQIAECMVFDKFLKKAELLRIESYLALKYGITMVASNYVTGRDTVVWNYDSNKVYSNAIAGIGRDSVYGLHQRQSNSVEDNGLLTIGKGSFRTLNQDKSDSLPEGSYLIWGNDEGALSCENTWDSLPLWERKWRMQVRAGNTIETNVKLKAPYRIKNAIYYLVIDRSGSGDFDTSSTEYIAESYVDSSGNVYFEDVVWDTDSSGKDVFTFSPGRVTAGAMSIIMMPDTGCKNLGMKKEYELEKGGSVSVCIDKECIKATHCQWTKNGQVIGEGEKLEAKEEGTYTVTATLEDGSVVEGQTIVIYGNDMITSEYCTYNVYPNPSSGAYTVEVSLLEPSDIRVKTYTVTGSLLKEESDQGKTHYVFEGNITTQGTYFIDIITGYEKKTIKVVITK